MRKFCKKKQTCQKKVAKSQKLVKEMSQKVTKQKKNT